MGKKSKQLIPEHKSELEKKVELLEKQLEWEKLRSLALDTMINVAERELQIDIRKRHQTVREIKQGSDDISLQSLCRLFGHSRQAFYKHHQLQFSTLSETKCIIEQVLHIRSHQPRCGDRKLLIMLQPFLKQQKINTGRDAFFNLLAKTNYWFVTENEVLLPPTPNTSFTGIPTW